MGVDKPAAPADREPVDYWQLLVASIEDYAIFMLDLNGVVQTWNRGAEKNKGYKSDEIIGKHFSIFYTEQDIAAGKPARELRIAEVEGRVEDEGWRVRKDGSRFLANVVITALRDQHGRLHGFAKVTRDVSARRAHEETLRRSEERMRLMVEAVSDYAIYMLSPEGDVSTWNTGAQRLKGYAAEEIIGQNYAVFFPPEDVRAGKPTRELATAAAEGRFEEEGVRIRKNGERFLASVVVTPIRGLDGRLLGFSKVTRDLSSREASERMARQLAQEQAARVAAQEAEEKLRDSERRFREAAQEADEANRIKDEFLATVSHELRTPLNAIFGWSAVLIGRTDDPSLTKGLEVIHRNALSQAKIIDDILDVSRIITGKLRLDLRTVDLVQVLRHAMDVVRPSAQAKRITLDLQTMEPDAWLVADTERLQQIAWNLLSNAVKFSKEGDVVTACIVRDGAKMTLLVQDRGQGIEETFLPFVFDRFRQADNSSSRRVGGLGLGLAIVRHLAEMHGGSVDVTSEGPGEGSLFRVSLPVRAIAPTARQVDAVRVEEPDTRPLHALSDSPLRGKRVLVVDDEADARELVLTVLMEAGADVEEASTAAQGFAALQRFQPHILVCDIGMPGEDGYALMQRIRALGRLGGGGIPALALTAYTRPEDKTRALAAGFTTHVGKPVDPRELLLSVASLAALARP